MIMSAVLAMFIDSITVILFLAAVTIELSSLLKFNPVPMIMAEIFCANLGGSATMCGDPPNIIIGQRFITFCGFCVEYRCDCRYFPDCNCDLFLLCFPQGLKVKTGKIEVTEADLDPSKAIHDKKGFVISTAIFLLAVALLVTHAQTKLTVAFIGVLIAVLRFCAGKHALAII